MKLIATLFIVYFFGKVVDCNNDQSKSASNDKPVVASNQQSGPESRQISSYPSNHYLSSQDSSASKINVALNNLSPKESAYHNSHPNSPVGYIQIQPVLAPFSYHAPETSGSTTFLNIIKPTQIGVRRSLLTNKFKNYFSSLLNWKDTSNASPYSSPYMTSGSSYSFSLKQPPPQFNFQPNAASIQASNYADSNGLTSSSQYKPVIFRNYPSGYQPDSKVANFGNKHMSSYSGSLSGGSSYTSPFFNSISSNNQANVYGSPSAMNPNLYSNFNSYHTRNNNLNSNKFYNSGNSNTGFPPSSYQMNSASSNMNAIYASPGQKSNQQDTNGNSFNQRPEISSSINSKQAPAFNSAVDNAASSSAVASS